MGAVLMTIVVLAKDTVQEEPNGGDAQGQV